MARLFRRFLLFAALPLALCLLGLGLYWQFCRDSVYLDLSALENEAHPAWSGTLQELKARAGKALSPRFRLSGSAFSASVVLEFRDSWAPEAAAGRVLAYRIYAERGGLWDSRSWTDAPASAETVPLDTLRLPERALLHPVLRFSDPAYPLRRVLAVEASGPGRQAASALAALAAAFPLPPPPRVALVAAAGDMIFQRGSDALLLSGGPRAVFGDALDVLARADAVAANFEGTATLKGDRTPKTYNFRFPPAVLGPLKAAGFTYLSFANNHVWDYGSAAFLDTLSNLRKAGFGVSGAGRNLAEAREPWTWNGPGGRFGFFSLGAYPREGNGFDGAASAAAGPDKPGVLWADEANLADLKARLRGFDASIVSVHGGVEWEDAPRPSYAKLYRSLADAGASAVFAHHPHVLQGIEVRNGVPIFYSLGNFVFPGMGGEAHATESVVALVCFVDGVARGLELHPVKLDGPRVRLDRGGNTLARLRELSLLVPR